MFVASIKCMVYHDVDHYNNGDDDDEDRKT